MEFLEEVRSRIAEMSEQRRATLLQRAGVIPAALRPQPTTQQQQEAADDWAWPFPTNLPPRHKLYEYLQHSYWQQQQEQAAVQWQPQPYQPPGPLQQGQQQHAEAHQQQRQQEQQGRPILLELLEQSRTFQAPDCADAMAEELGVADLHRGVRGSLVLPPEPEEHVAAQRSALRAALKSAWSKEALRRGVSLAKSGDLSAAVPCYDQALELDSSNADALVARGAAHANQERWQRASDDLEAALELQADHPNAGGYLRAVQAKAAAAGVRLQPLADGRRQAEEQLKEQQQQEQQQRRSGGLGVSQQHKQPQERQEQGVASRPQNYSAPPTGRQRQDNAAKSAGLTDERERGRKRDRSRSRGRGSSRSRSGSRRRPRGRRRSQSGSGSGGSRQQYRRWRSRDRSTSRSSLSSISGTSGSSRSYDDEAGGQEASAYAPQLGAVSSALSAPLDIATALSIVARHYKKTSRHSKGKARKDRDKDKKKGRHRQKKQKHKRQKKR